MKQIAILVITLGIIIISGIWEISYLKESANYFLADASNLYQTAERKDYDNVEQEIKNVKETWKKVEKTWALFIDDNKMDKIEEEFVSFVSYVESKDESEIRKSYKCLAASIKDIAEHECLNAENIF